MPSREPRRRRSGQVSSWTPATTTRSHSRPLDRCAVRIRTASSRVACSASVSPAISWPARLSMNRPGAPGGSVSVNRLAASNSASTASRSRSAAAPAAPPAVLAACQTGARPEASQTAQRVSSAVSAGRDGVPCDGQQPRQLLRGRRDRPRDHDQLARVEDGGGQQVARIVRPARARGGRIGAGRITDHAQPAAQAAQPESVGAAERPGEQLGGGLLVQRLGPQRAAQQGQQRPGPRFLGQRQLVPGDGHRDARRAQGPPQQRDLPGRRTDQDRHRRPRDAAGQVGAAERVRDERGFLARALRDRDPDLAGLGAGPGP